MNSCCCIMNSCNKERVRGSRDRSLYLVKRVRRRDELFAQGAVMQLLAGNTCAGEGARMLFCCTDGPGEDGRLRNGEAPGMPAESQLDRLRNAGEGSLYGGTNRLSFSNKNEKYL